MQCPVSLSYTLIELTNPLGPLKDFIKLDVAAMQIYIGTSNSSYVDIYDFILQVKEPISGLINNDFKFEVRI